MFISYVKHTVIETLETKTLLSLKALNEGKISMYLTKLAVSSTVLQFVNAITQKVAEENLHGFFYHVGNI